MQPSLSAVLALSQRECEEAMKPWFVYAVIFQISSPLSVFIQQAVTVIFAILHPVPNNLTCSLQRSRIPLYKKLSLYQAVEAHRVVRRRGSHIFSRQSAHRWLWSFQPYAPSALYRQKDSWYSFLLDWVDPRAIVRLEGIGQSKNIMTSSGI
jgi:hypothetical protein